MNRICAALDVADAGAAERLASRLVGHVGLFKVGLELFVADGRAAVEAVRRFGQPIFLDLKLHDIPQTVEGAARGVASLAVDYVTVHASGGAEMIRAARRALPRTKLLAVTALTSLGPDDLDAVGLSRDAVTRLARLAMEAGADGVVCSPQEVAALRAALGPRPLLVVPGIRPAHTNAERSKYWSAVGCEMLPSRTASGRTEPRAGAPVPDESPPL